MLTFKPEVQVIVFDDRIGLVIREASLWAVMNATPVHVSSIDDSAPKRVIGTLHGRGLAIDINVVTPDATKLEELADWMRVRLPAGFDVIWESNHVHVEVDAHRPALPAVPLQAG